jgi:hypothetical protein
MIRTAISVFALALLFSSAQASGPLDQGGYIGGGIGSSRFDDSFVIVDFSRDDSDSASMLFAGYKFSRYLSLEGRYSDFGSFLVFGDPADLSALSLHAVGTVPFGDSGWELYGQLGFGTVNFDYFNFAEEDESALAGGIGLRFRPSRNFSIGVQADVFTWDDNLLGPAYDSGIGTTTVTASIYF